MDLAVVYEDDALIIIDKPAGLVVHPAPGNLENTLVNALLAHCGGSQPCNIQANAAHMAALLSSTPIQGCPKSFPSARIAPCAGGNIEA